MRTKHIITTMCVLFTVVLAAGCGPDTAAQLKQAQDDLAKAQAKTAAAEKERDALRLEMVRCTKEREQALNDVKFFAKKVNPLELANFEKGQAIEKLQKELEECKKAASEMKAAAETAPAPPVAPAVPATEQEPKSETLQ